MAPHFRRLVTQSSSLSGSPNSNDAGAGATATGAAGGDSDSAGEKATVPTSATSASPAIDSSTAASTHNSLSNPNATGQAGNAFSFANISPSNAKANAAPVPAAPVPAELVPAVPVQPMPPHTPSMSTSAVVAGVGMAQHHQSLHSPVNTFAQHHFLPGGMSSSLLPPHMTAAPIFFKDAKLRRGKWTQEEEKYASFLIKEFENGSLTDCENGCTLRSYISKKLHCAPMRISKKFAGKSIGKHVFLSRSSGGSGGNSMEERNKRIHELRELEEQFYHSLIREGSSIPMDPSRTMPPTLMSHGMHPFGSTGFPQHHQPFPLAQGSFFQGWVLNGSGMVPPPFPTPHTLPVQGSSTTQVASWPVTGAPQQMGAGSNMPNTANDLTSHDHAKQLEQSFLKAMKQAQPKEGGTDVSNTTNTQHDTAKGGDTKSSNTPEGSSTSLKVQFSQNTSTATASEASSSAAGPTKEMPDFLSGFDSMAFHAAKGTDSSSNQLPPVPLWPSEGCMNHCSPTFTSKSFDDLHKHLGSDIPTTNFELNCNQSDGNKVAAGPATVALTQQQNAHFFNGKVHTEEELRGMPQPALLSMHNNEQNGNAVGGMGRLSLPNAHVTADAYAMFAQQSAIAVSQHSAYCRSDIIQPGTVPPIAGTKRTAAHLISGTSSFMQNRTSTSQHVPALQGSARQVAIISDDSSAAYSTSNGQRSSSSGSCTSSVVNSANLKAHTKAMKAKARQEQQTEQDESSSSSSDSSSLVKRHHHHRSQKRPRISTTTEYMSGTHANIVSGSDRSGSELGTETESALSSSHGSSTGSGSGSDNGSDNASDQSDMASDEDGAAKPTDTNVAQNKRCDNALQMQDCASRGLVCTSNNLPQSKPNFGLPGSQ